MKPVATVEQIKKWLEELDKKTKKINVRKLPLLVVLVFLGCGKEDLAKVEPTPSPTASVSPTGQPNAKPSTEIAGTPGSNPSPSVSPSATVEPNPFQSLHLIVQQPYETNKWKFDLTNPNNTYPDGSANDVKYMKNIVTVSKKSIDSFGVTTVTACTFRAYVYIPANPTVETQGKIMLQAGASVGIAGVQPAACQASTLQYINFKISNKCKGYSQDTYKCGQNINYDLVEF